jgi:hypothetical protein
VLQLKFDDDLEGKLDLSGDFHDPETFPDFRLDAKSQAVVWQDGTTLTADTLHKRLHVELMFSPEKYCPRCGSSRFVPIVYGLPFPETFERALLGELVLGGCFELDSANWSCKDCNSTFRYPSMSSQRKLNDVL